MTKTTKGLTTKPDDKSISPKSKIGSTDSMLDIDSTLNKKGPRNYHFNFKEKLDTHTDSDSDRENENTLDFHKAEVVGEGPLS